MSKFLPMFKKKGKGKEEEVHDDAKKKRSKSHKLAKEILSHPSPSAVFRAEKKRKSAKRKAPAPQGKENYPSVQELEKEFFIDDNGVVRECPTELYVDAAGAVREGPRELFIDNALALDDSAAETISDTSHEDCLLAGERQENGGSPYQNNGDLSAEKRLSAAYEDFGDSDSNFDSSYEETPTKPYEYAMKSQENEREEKDSGDEVVVLRNPKKRESDVPLSANLANRLSISEQLQHWQEEEAVMLDSDPITDSTEDLQKELAAANKNKVLENLHQVIDVNDTVNVPVVIAPDVGDDNITVRMEENTVAEAEVGEEAGLLMAHEDSQVETFYSNTPTTHGSDDDFDSAKEDWDEESAEEKDVKESQERSILQKEDFEISNSIARLTEAENEELRDRYEADSRHASTTSSIYQDAHSREDSLHDINSIIEATNDDTAVVIDSGQSDKLTRKISNVSASSSDIFNEELDDLLDEELDRLSEEESNCTDLNTTVMEGNCQGVADTGASMPPYPQQTVTAIKENQPHMSYSENNEVIAEEKSETASPEEEENVEVTPAERESGYANDENNYNQPHEDSLDNTDVPQQNCTVMASDETLQEGEQSADNVVLEESVVTKAESTQAASECGLDQAKDSGYYSLPVSPKPNTVTEKEGEQQQSPPPESSLPQHPQQEGQEGTSNAHREMTGATEVPDTTEMKNVSLEDSVPGKPSESCSEADWASHTTTNTPVDESLPGKENHETTVIVRKEETTVTGKQEGTVTENKENVTTETEEKETTAINETEKNKNVTAVTGNSEETTVTTEMGNEENVITETGKGKAETFVTMEPKEIPPKSEEKKRPKLDMSKSSAAPHPKGSTPSPGPEVPVRGRHSRHKSPGLGGDEALLSPDPVGERFLEQAVCLSHQEAEARLAQRRAARAEARELRLRELEKQQHEQDNEEEKQFGSPSYSEPVPRAGATGRGAGRASGAVNSGGQYSRRSSEDSTADEATMPANVREMRSELKELEEKFRKAMITNAQLDNEKATLTFEVELMKDRYTELEEAHTQLTKEHRRKCTEYEQLRKVSMKLQEEVKILRSMLQERDQLIQEYGLVVLGEEKNGEGVDHREEEEEEDEDVDDLTPRKLSVKKVLVSQEVAELLSKGAAQGSLDVRLKKFCEEKNDLEDEVRRLKLELEEERSRSRRRENGLDNEKQKEQSKTVNEYKFRVQKAEAEVSTLQANVARLDALSTRYRTQSEELERSEEELKLEKRKLQRELRDAQSRLEELETTNNHLIKRFDKLKNARSNLLKDLSQDPA